MPGYGFGYSPSVRRLVSTGPSTDPDADAFIAAAGITNPTQQSAIQTLVTDLKGYGIWTKMSAIYPIVGGTSTSHSYNLKNTAQYQLAFNGGWTHSSTGADPNGTNGYANTSLTASTVLTNNNTHLSYYCRENVSGGVIDMGCRDAYTGIELYNYSGGYYSDQYNNSSGRASSSNADTRGFIVGSRTASNVHKLFRNGSQIGSTNTGSASSIPSSLNIFLAATNQSGTAQYYTSRQYAFFSIGDGLTDTESANFYTAVQAFQTTLGRNV